AIRQRTKRDTALTTAESKPAFGTAGERHRLRRIEIGKFHFSPVTPFDGTNTDGHVGAEMRVGDFLDAMATRDHRGKGRGIEQHVPDPLRARPNRRLTLPVQLSVAVPLGLRWWALSRR